MLHNKNLFKHWLCLLIVLSSLSSLAYSQNKITDNVEQKIKIQTQEIEAEKNNLTSNEKKVSSYLRGLIHKIKKDKQIGGFDNESIRKKYISLSNGINNDLQINIVVTLLQGKDSDSTNVRLLIKNLGGRVSLSIKPNELKPVEIYCWLGYDKIVELGAHPSIGNISPIIGSETREGARLTIGDSQLQADKVRQYFNIDGSGIKVGVISDGVDDIENSIASGDLPPINDTYHILENGTGNEGTAMLEIIYDLAPGAEYYFAGNSNNGPNNMANLISDLSNAGCKIIVDDLGFPYDSPQFEPDALFNRIEYFRNYENGIYISAAGNDGMGSWYGTFSPNAVGYNAWWKLTNGNYDTFNYFNVGEVGKNVTVIIQWADKWNFARTDYDLYVYDTFGNLVENSGGTDVQGVNGSVPREVVSFTYDTQTHTAPFYVVVKLDETHTYENEPNKEFRLIVSNNESLGYTYQNFPNDPEAPKYQIYGKEIASTIPVGAYPASDPDIIESFSSRGPSKLFSFDVSGNKTGEQTYETPIVIATDGVETNAAGFKIFYGTSAAAPHVAGITVLYTSVFPRSQFLSSIKHSSTTIEGYAGGTFNGQSGYGKINALEAMIYSLTPHSPGTIHSNTGWAQYRIEGTVTISSNVTVDILPNSFVAITGTVNFGNSNSKIIVASGSTLLVRKNAIADPSHITGNVIYEGGVSVKQIGENSEELRGSSFGRWEGGPSFEDYTVPQVFSGVDAGDREVFQAYQGIVSNQKYHHWLVNDISTPTIKNQQVFYIQEVPSSYSAQFLQAYPSVVIKNSIEDNSLNSGVIQFRDPWFVDEADVDYNNILRNRGIQAIYRDRSSPFNPNYSTIYENNKSYNGVFLDQGYDGQNWAEPFYKVKAPAQTISINGNNHQIYFLNWSATNAALQNFTSAETGVAFHSDNAVVTANYKGSKLSTTTNALIGPSQRKIARTSDGYYHLVYESMGKVWYEYSSNGNDWQLVDIGTVESKLPSVDTYGNRVAVTYQGKYGSNSEIRTYLFNSGSTQNLFYGAAPIVSGYGDYKPIVALGGNDRVFIALINSSGSVSTYLLYNNPDMGPGMSDVITESSNVNNVSVAADKSQEHVYHIAWQESTSRVEYIKFAYHSGSFQGHAVVSNNSGYENHKNPEVTVVNGLPIVGWVGERTEGGELPPPPIWKTNAFGGGGSTLQTSRRGILRKQNSNGTWSSTFYKYGSDVIDVALNTTGSSHVFAFYSESSDDLNPNIRQTKAVKGESTIVYNIASNGSEYYFSNGTNYNNMYGVDVNLGTDFNPASAPFSLRANSLFTVNKISAADSVLIGREGITTRDSVQFYFTFGEIMVDGVQVNFVDIPDSMKEIKNANQLNKYLVSEPFTLNDNSEFTYGIMCGVADSSDVDIALKRNEFINFKVELIAGQSSHVLGVYDNVTFTADSINYYANKNYFVNTNGVGNKTVRLRMQIKDNFKQSYSLGNLLVEDSLMYKKGYHQLHYKGELLVKEYSLVQNYPNPFNPSTIIKYQIPQAGNVRLIVYDILGREVTKLIDEFQNDGRYEVKFDASNLSSGIYIYRLEANDFVDSKKMMLVK